MFKYTAQAVGSSINDQAELRCRLNCVFMFEYGINVFISVYKTHLHSRTSNIVIFYSLSIYI